MEEDLLPLHVPEQNQQIRMLQVKEEEPLRRVI